MVILEVDASKRRVSLGLKQTMRNPWEEFAEKHPVGSTVEGEVKNKTEFGLFLGLEGDVDGMVHLSDLDWNRSGEEAMEDYKKGETVQAKVLDVDVEKERISLGVKQVKGDPMTEGAASGVKKGAIVTGEVTQVTDSGIEVKIADTDLTAFIRRAELSRDRSEQRPDRFAPGEKVDARVTNIDKKTRKIALSIKALRDLRGEGSGGPVRLDRLRRLARRHPGRRAEEAGDGRGRRRGQEAGGIILGRLILRKIEKARGIAAGLLFWGSGRYSSPRLPRRGSS